MKWCRMKGVGTSFSVHHWWWGRVWEVGGMPAMSWQELTTKPVVHHIKMPFILPRRLGGSSWGGVRWVAGELLIALEGYPNPESPDPLGLTVRANKALDSSFCMGTGKFNRYCADRTRHQQYPYSLEHTSVNFVVLNPFFCDDSTMKRCQMSQSCMKEKDSEETIGYCDAMLLCQSGFSIVGQRCFPISQSIINDATLRDWYWKGTSFSGSASAPVQILMFRCGFVKGLIDTCRSLLFRNKIYVAVWIEIYINNIYRNKAEYFKEI